MSTSVMALPDVVEGAAGVAERLGDAPRGGGAQEAANPVTQMPSSRSAGTCASASALLIASWKQSWK